MPSSAIDVFFNVDKPRGPTSHDIVARLRRATGIRRIGHAGTLDPMATGVLIVAIGRATRLIEYVADADKAYRAEVTFGVETDTYDAEGQIVTRSEPSHLTREAVEAALPTFRGMIQQRPPAHSAISVGGKRLYELARAGKPVEAPLRTVEITALELLTWQPPVAALAVECSRGTYIRSLAHDLGAAVGTGAHLSALTRTRVGRFELERATPLDTLESHLRQGTWPDDATSLEDAVSHIPAVALDEDALAKLTNGIAVACSPAEAEGPCGVAASRPPDPTDSTARLSHAGTLRRVSGPDGRLVAMVQLIERAGALYCRPDKVLAGAS